MSGGWVRLHVSRMLATSILIWPGGVKRDPHYLTPGPSLAVFAVRQRGMASRLLLLPCLSAWNSSLRLLLQPANRTLACTATLPLIIALVLQEWCAPPLQLDWEGPKTDCMLTGDVLPSIMLPPPIQAASLETIHKMILFSR